MLSVELFCECAAGSSVFAISACIIIINIVDIVVDGHIQQSTAAAPCRVEYQLFTSTAAGTQVAAFDQTQNEDSDITKRIGLHSRLHHHAFLIEISTIACIRRQELMQYFYVLFHRKAAGV